MYPLHSWVHGKTNGNGAPCPRVQPYDPRYFERHTRRQQATEVSNGARQTTGYYVHEATTVLKSLWLFCIGKRALPKKRVGLLVGLLLCEYFSHWLWMHASIYILVYKCTSMFRCIDLWVRLYMCMCVCICMLDCVCMYACMRANMCTWLTERILTKCHKILRANFSEYLFSVIWFLT